MKKCRKIYACLWLSLPLFVWVCVSGSQCGFESHPGDNKLESLPPTLLACLCVCVWATHRADSKWDSCKWRRCWPPPFPLLALRMPSYVSGISLKNPLAWHSRQITKVPGAGDNHSSGLSNVGACLQNNTNKIKDPCDTLEVNLIFFLKSLSSRRSAIGFSWDIGVIPFRCIFFVYRFG